MTTDVARWGAAARSTSTAELTLSRPARQPTPHALKGIAMSHVAPLRAEDGLFLGEPLLLKFASWIFWGSLPDTQTLVLHPVGFAAWFGLTFILRGLYSAFDWELLMVVAIGAAGAFVAGSMATSVITDADRVRVTNRLTLWPGRSPPGAALHEQPRCRA